MALFYKHFLALGTVLALVFFAGAALAADPVFTVEDIEVDVTAANAIEAREQAFEEAQTKAFEELATRMLPANELATMSPPESLTISALIEDFEITQEKLSSVRYIGTYTFRFKDSAVRRHFAGAGTAFSDISSEALLILPFLQTDRGMILWSPFNTWMQAWNRAQNLRGLVPLEVPLGDLDDVRDLPDNAALSYNAASLEAITQRYGAGEAVIAIAIPNNNGVKIEVYRTDLGRPELVRQVNVPAAANQEALYDDAARRVHAALQRDWKARTTVSSQAMSSLRVLIPVRTLAEWTQIQFDLKRAAGIEDAILKSLSPGQATVDLLFQGDTERLVLSLTQAGYNLEQGQNTVGQPINILRTGGSIPAPDDGGYRRRL